MITVTITRSGGVAGLSRSWYLFLAAEEWQDLCSRAQGDEQPERARDRYTYRVRARGEVLVIPESRWDEGWRGLLERAEPGEPVPADAEAASDGDAGGLGGGPAETP